jgi:hypothetical protein
MPYANPARRFEAETGFRLAPEGRITAPEGRIGAFAAPVNADAQWQTGFRLAPE